MSAKHVPWIALAALGAVAIGVPDSAAAEERSVSGERYDFRIPHVSEVYSPVQIERFLAHTWSENAEVVEVEGVREGEGSATPDVWPGLLAPVWAALNPAQAWRIFMPVPQEQVSDEPPAVLASTYREPAGIVDPISTDGFYP